MLWLLASGQSKYRISCINQTLYSTCLPWCLQSTQVPQLRGGEETEGICRVHKWLVKGNRHHIQTIFSRCLCWKAVQRALGNIWPGSLNLSAPGGTWVLISRTTIAQAQSALFMGSLSKASLSALTPLHKGRLSSAILWKDMCWEHRDSWGLGRTGPPWFSGRCLWSSPGNTGCCTARIIPRNYLTQWIKNTVFP